MLYYIILVQQKNFTGGKGGGVPVLSLSIFYFFINPIAQID